MQQEKIPIVVKLFIKFLKKNKVYSLYRERCSNRPLPYFFHDDAKFYIGGYFIWKGSERYMWRELNEKWIEILKKIKYGEKNVF